MALPQAKIDATEARLAALSLPEGSGWAREAREAALARVTAMGLPHRRDEYWRFTDPAPLNAAEPAQATPFNNPGEAPIFGRIERLRIVFVDGVFVPEASDDLTGENLEIMRLSEAMEADIHWARELYGVLEARGQNPVPRPLAALNTAFATDGVAIRATGKVSKPVALVYLHGEPDSDAILHNVIKVEPGADLTVMESGPAAARFNAATEVEVAEGGAFHHVRVQGRAQERQAVTHLFARIAAEASFKSFTLTVNGKLTRNETVLELVGDHGTAHVAGAAVGNGEFHHDDTVFITHDAEHCESRQVFKKVLKKGAVGTFQGKILVKEGAQKTDGYQISQSLLLDGDSQFLAKPELEIYADDVACSHGSTSGAMDEDALFYLRSRGLPKEEAQNLMVLAFLAEAVDEIENEVIGEELVKRLDAWLSFGKTDEPG
jgi:Fe-S cluster assembly protein SufD